MFDQINGLPVHALVLHTAVVFVPLLALGAIAYGVVPRWRPKIGWAVASLAVVAPLCTFVAKESGEKLRDRLVGNGLQGKSLDAINTHMHFGNTTFWYVLALGVVTLVFWFFTRRETSSVPQVAQWVGAVVLIVLAVASFYYVYRTGDTGAKAVWGQA